MASHNLCTSQLKMFACTTHTVHVFLTWQMLHQPSVINKIYNVWTRECGLSHVCFLNSPDTLELRCGYPLFAAIKPLFLCHKHISEVKECGARWPDLPYESQFIPKVFRGVEYFLSKLVKPYIFRPLFMHRGILMLEHVLSLNFSKGNL